MQKIGTLESFFALFAKTKSKSGNNSVLLQNTLGIRKRVCVLEGRTDQKNKPAGGLSLEQQTKQNICLFSVRVCSAAGVSSGFISCCARANVPFLRQ